MKSFNFWQTWLFVISIVLIVFGLLLAFFNQSVPFEVTFNANVDPHFWGLEAPTPDALLFQQWIYGVLGATIAGWGALLASLIRAAFHKKELWVWNSILYSMALWYVADTAISLQFSVEFNVIFNTLLLILVALPLTFTRRYFSPEPSKRHHHHSQKGKP